MITTILFDASGIFFNQPEDLRRKLWQHLGLNESSIADDIIYGTGLWDTYIRGSITEEEFWVRVIDALPFDYKGSWSSLCRLFERSVWLDTELVTFVEMLKKNYDIHVLTNAGSELERRIQHFGLSKLFNHVLSSHTVKMAKPDKAFYRLAADLLEIKPEHVLCVESNHKDAEAAQKLGFHTHIYKSVHDLQRVLTYNLDDEVQQVMGYA